MLCETTRGVFFSLVGASSSSAKRCSNSCVYVVLNRFANIQSSTHRLSLTANRPDAQRRDSQRLDGQNIAMTNAQIVFRRDSEPKVLYAHKHFGLQDDTCFESVYERSTDDRAETNAADVYCSFCTTCIESTRKDGIRARFTSSSD